MTTYPATFGIPQVRASSRALSQPLMTGVLVGLCLSIAALGRFCFLLRPFDNDAAIFIYMGQMVCHGQRLCHDLIDNKFPGVGLMTSIVWRCFGTCWPAYVALQALISLATATSLARTAGQLAGQQARLPTFLFSILFLNFTTAVFGGFQLETLQVFFIALSAGSGIDLLRGHRASDGFVAGLCAGMGAMFKPTAIGIVIVIALLSLGQFRKKHSGLIAMFAGLCIPLAAGLIYLISSGLLLDMPALARQISTYARESVFDWVELIKPITALLLLGFPMFIRGVVGRRHRDTQAAVLPRSIILFLLLWLAIETTGIVLQRRMYAYHFLPMIPPAALLFGLLPRHNRPGLLAAALLPIALLSCVQAGNLIATTRPGPTTLPLSEYLIAHAKPGDAVWMDAYPRLILETRLRPAARLPFTFLFTNYDEAGLDYSAGMLADFERTKPAYIILPVPLDKRLAYQIDFIPELNRRPIRRASYIQGWHRIEQYTLDHYDKVAMVGNDAVYHRRGK